MDLDIIREKNNLEKIVILSDESSIIDSLKLYFHDYEIIGLEDPALAIDFLRENHYDLLILDYVMNSVHLDYLISEIRTFDKDLYILLITEPKDLVSPIETLRKLDVQSYYEKSENFDQLILLVQSAIKSIQQLKLIKEINQELAVSSNLLEKSYLESIQILRNTVEAKDYYTKGHSDRVSEYALLIGEKLSLSPSEMQILRIGSLFHDIGKIGIPDSILLNDGSLTDEEYSKIKEHPAIGAHILSNASVFSDIIPIVKYHHEYYDGNGYPDGLAGENIPLLARIVAVADSFDAITSRRSYRDASSFAKARDEIKRCSGTQFDPNIAKIFLDILDNNYDKILEIHKKY